MKENFLCAFCAKFRQASCFFVKKTLSGNKEYDTAVSLKVLFKPAFSLVEMLMALLVASLLLAALAPVITKRIEAENVNLYGSIGNSKAPDAMVCYTYNDANSVVENIPLNKVWYASFIIASGGGGGGGASKEDEQDGTLQVEATGTASKDTKSTPLTITANMVPESFDISLVSGGGGGGGAAAYGKAGYTTENITEGGNVITGNTSSGCPSGSNIVRTGSICTYKVAATASWTDANAACTSLTAGSLKAGSWKLPTKNQIRNNWTTSNMPGGLSYGYYWSNDFYCSGTSNSFCNSRCSGGSAHDYALREENNTSWNSSNSYHGCDTGNARYYCILSGAYTIDTTVTYTNYIAKVDIKSFSGSGGGGGTGFESLKYFNNQAYSDFKEAIANNIGGTIVLQAGGGGAKGASDSISKTAAGSTNAKSGETGKESCISILNKSKAEVYKACAKGGNAGIGVTNITNIKDTVISTPAGPLQLYNGCYYTYKGVTKNFNCNGGNPGIDGTSVYKTTSLTTKNSLVWPGLSAIAQVSNHGNGIQFTGAGAKHYGAGGNGAGIASSITDDGNFVITTSSYIAQDGSPGFARVTYKKKFDAAGGGGGGGGSIVQLKNIFVGENSTCTFTMGKGGKGGNAALSPGAPGENGEDGGNSKVSCTPNIEFIVPGAKGGLGGTSTTAQGAPAVAGEGGKGAVISLTESNISNIEPDKKLIREGYSGETATAYSNYFAGGKGGISGTGTQGGCGALYESGDGICTFDTSIPVNSDMLIGAGYPTYNDIIRPYEKDIISSPPSFGTAGAGGGGGAWYKNIGSGSGGNGLGGYVCVYWNNQTESE